jgi:hypothetical protein
MAARALPTPRQRLLRQRQHGAVLEQVDRRDLERSGWRTTIEFRENLVRGRDGRLLQVEEIWHAEAERHGTRGVDFIYATAESIDLAWAKLRRRAEIADVRPPQRSQDRAS